jgi:drug/metabolite transporter (DMT)-like permease
MALAAAMSWALYPNLTRRWSEPGSGGAAGLLATGLVLLAVRLWWKETTLWNAHAGWEMAVMGVITALAYGLWDVAIAKGNLLMVAACSYLTPLLSSFVSCVYLKVMPGPKLWLGCLLVVLGSFLTWLSVWDPVRSGVEAQAATN